MGLRLPRRTVRAEHVRVVLDGGGPAFDAAVVRSVDGGAQLTPVTAAAPPVRALHRRRAIVSAGAERPERHVLLLAIRDAAGALRDDVVLAVWAGDTSQRRAFARIPAFRPVELVPELRGVRRPPRLQGITRDISAGGTLLGGRTAAALNAGERLALRLALDDHGEELRAGGVVVRSDADSSIAAVRLESVDPRDVQRLVRWVRAREIDALARLRG